MPDPQAGALRLENETLLLKVWVLCGLLCGSHGFEPHCFLKLDVLGLIFKVQVLKSWAPLSSQEEALGFEFSPDYESWCGEGFMVRLSQPLLSTSMWAFSCLPDA